MTVITLARQVGSGGQAVAAGLSERLGYQVVGRKEIRAKAIRQGFFLPESFERFASEDRGTSGLNHYLSYGELEFDSALRGAPHSEGEESRSPLLVELSANSREILLTLQILIYQIAAGDNVILVGAGSQILLSGFPNVLRVKIIAPSEIRVERMMEAYGLSESEATAAVKQGDREQIDYNRVIFGVDWHNPELWDLVINSELLTVNQIVQLISSHRPPELGTNTNLLQQSLFAAAAVNREFLVAAEDGPLYACAVPTPDGIAIRGDVPNTLVRDQMLEIATLAVPDMPFLDNLTQGASL